jgi:hypothetical protein
LDPKGTGQDSASKGLRALQVGVDLGLHLTDDGEAAVDFGDDSRLLLGGGKGKGRSLNLRCADVLNSDAFAARENLGFNILENQPRERRGDALIDEQQTRSLIL